MIEETEAAVRAGPGGSRSVAMMPRETFDPALEARQRATRWMSCLRIQPDEKSTLITDRACLEIGAALAPSWNGAV